MSLDDKIDRIAADLGDIKALLFAESQARKDLTRRTEELEKGLEPVKLHIAAGQGIVKLLSLAAMMAAAMEGVMALLTYFRK
jgi:hypothetical protein